ncbi:S26 family signal peptidase [Streptomyces mobaraensis]|uniref:S26 family signal peptidase n=1 Tax=Streptomyces mobaraensis TaxID=35621 RepID=UPI00332A97E2
MSRKRFRWVVTAVPALALTAAWLVRGLIVVTVAGPSMEPAHRHGDRLLAWRRRRPAVGRVVVVEIPGTGPSSAGDTGDLADRYWMIKRVAAVPGDPVPRERVPALSDVPEERVPSGRLVLLGDNSEFSRDSRRMGYFAADRVLGTVLCRLW